METTARERELQQRQTWWPLDTMACSSDISTISSSSIFGWDPQLFYLGHGAVGNGASDSGAHDRHELELLVPKCMESLVMSEVSTAATGLPTVQDVAAMRRELDELLQNLWDSEEEEGLSSCDALNLKEEGDVASQHVHHFDLGTVSPTVPTSPEKTLATPPQAELPSLSSSQGSRGPQASDASGAHRQIFGASKRSAPGEGGSKKGRGGCKRSRMALSAVGTGGSSVLRPFDVVKPGGADGKATLADVNEWILTPPARPVRHPVGEFAPRVSAGNRPAPLGKTVVGFTRLHTAGRGTITVVRTRG